MHVVPRIMRQPEAFPDPQNAPKSLAAGALPQTPLGELSALPRPPSWIQGVLLLSGGEGKGCEGREGEEGRGREGRGGRVCLVLKLPLATPYKLNNIVFCRCSPVYRQYQ